MNGRPTVRHG